MKTQNKVLTSLEIGTGLQYRVFEWLRFPLIVGVVFIHCFGRPSDYAATDFCHLTGMDYFNLFRVSISHVITHVCVPTFFFISGYLFFKGLETWDFKAYGRKLKRRVNTLLVPFLIWNTISILIVCFGLFRSEGVNGVHTFLADNGYWHLYWDSKNLSEGQTNWIGGGVLSTSPQLVPLWYLRDLMVVAICSPVLWFLFKKTKAYGLLLLTICYVSGVFVNISGFSAMAFLFFGAGAYCIMYNINPTTYAYRYRKPIMLITAFLIVVLTSLDGHNTKQGNLIYPFYVGIGFVNAINVATFFVKNEIIKIPTFLSMSAFFIYLAHKVAFINKLTQICESIFGLSTPLLMTISYLAVPIMTVCICLLLYYLLSRFTPRLCGVLMGGR